MARLKTTATSAAEKQGTGGNCATVSRKTRGGNIVGRQRDKWKVKRQRQAKVES